MLLRNGLIFLIMLSAVAHSQEIILSGKVRHANTFAGIPGVNIYVDKTGIGTTSQSDGQFYLKILEADDQTSVIFEHIAFDSLVLNLGECKNITDFYLRPRIIQLGEITVEAERMAPEIAKDIPQSMAVISARQYEVQGYIDAGDLLKTVQSVQVNEELSGEKTISIRAGNAEDVIVLFNGIKMNDTYENHFDLALINLEDVRRIELIKGSNTSLYGSEAFSGVVNFVPKTHQDYTIRFQQKFGTYNSGDWNLQLNHTFQNRFSLSYNVKQGASKREYTDAETSADFLENRINYHTANFVYDFESEDEQQPVNTISGMFMYSDFEYSDRRYNEALSNSNMIFSLNYQGGIADIPGFNITGSYQRLEKFEQGQLDLNLDNQKTTFHLEKVIKYKQVDFLVAAQSEQGELKINKTISLPGVQSANYHTQKTGLVSILKVHTPTGADFLKIADFDLSYRYDWVRYRPEDIVYTNPDDPLVEVEKYSWTSPTIKFSAHLSGKTADYQFNAFMNYGTNIKFPSVFQQISSPSSLNTNLPGLSPNLNPEKNRSTEIGIDILHRRTTPSIWEGWQVNINYFTNFYENKFRIFYNPPSVTAFFDNISDAGISGVELLGRAFMLQKKITLEFGLSRYSITQKDAFPFKSDSKQVFDVHLDHAGYSLQFHWFNEGDQVGWILDRASGEFRQLRLPDHSNIDIHFGKVFEIYDFKLITNFSARNLIHDTTQLAGIAIRDRRFYISFGFEY